VGPLSDVRVLELGQVVAGPYCGQVLADFGADVVKVEPPGIGDVLRQWGWAPDGKDSLWFRIAARGKRSITLDLRTEQGQDVVRRLAREVDVVVENFRPGTLEKWGLGYEDLSADNPGLVLVRISGFGQDGPYAGRPGYASIGEAMGGLRALTGFPDRPSVRVGLSLGDTLTGLLGAMGAIAALHERRRSGLGQVVDAAIYESVLSLTEGLVPEWSIAGLQRERTGPVLKGIAPSNVYPTADGEVLIAANQDSVFRRLCEVMDRPGLATDPRFADHKARGERADELDELIAAWTRARSSRALLEALHAASVPAGLVYTPADMVADPHFAERRSLIELNDPEVGVVLAPAPAPRLSRTPAQVRWPGPRLGQHTDEVLAGIGLTDSDIAALRADGVV
jgi:crotonobetainyl-CoA:carnitine CoA-transferase CaiB-like acyl-CoA transferase